MNRWLLSPFVIASCFLLALSCTDAAAQGVYDLSVITSGSGIVTSEPVGISCPGTCTYAFPEGTAITLTAAPTAPGATFKGGWGGACNGQWGPCFLTMDAAKTATAAFAAATPLPTDLALYDDFGTLPLDPARWKAPRETVREIRDGHLALALGAPAVNGGSTNVQLRHANPPTSLQSLQADLTLGDYTPPPGGRARLRLRGAFYNDGYGGAGATGRTGDVFAQITIRAYEATGPQITYGLTRCNDATCVAYTDLEFGILVTSANAHEMYALRIAWDGSQFTFTVNGTPTTVTPALAPPASPTARQGEILLRAEVQAFDVSGAPVPGGDGYVAATFDNVYINGALYDDFTGIANAAGPRIDRTKWLDGEIVREVTNWTLGMENYVPKGATSPQNTLGLPNPAAIRALTADLTVTAVSFADASGSWAQAGLQGAFYNKGTGTAAGDVWASVQVSASPGHTNVYFQLWHNDGGWTPLQNYMLESSNGSENRTFRLLLKWDEVAQVIVFGYDNDIQTIDPKPFAPVAGPAVSAARNLWASVASTPTSDTALAVRFDNVAVAFVPNTMPTLTVLKTGGGSGTVTSDIGGINCGSVCSAGIVVNAEVTLTATPENGSTFAGWSGEGCTGTDTCTVTMTQARTVTATFDPKPAATLLAPSGAGIGATPIYSWLAVPGATWYEIWVADSTTSKKLDIWYTADGVGCAGGGTCYVSPSIPLATGNATWWIQWWGPSGYGSWSQGMAFTVGAPSTMATLVSPSGTISASAPMYTWNAVPGMTWYYLWVDDTSQGGKVRVWMTAATAGCGSGTGTCSYTPTTAITPGPATWWIEGWSPAGYGPWSDGLGFTVGP